MFVPMSTYKGSGLAIVLGLLGGPLNRAAFGRDVKDANSPAERESNTGHFIIALDVARFLPLDVVQGRDRSPHPRSVRRRRSFRASMKSAFRDRAAWRAAPIAQTERRAAGAGADQAGRRTGQDAQHHAAVGAQLARACAGSSERGKLLAMTDATSQGSPFWRFSLQFYRLPKVADACIALQEEAGVDVNLLLFLLWQAQQRRRLSAPTSRRLKTKIAPWREATVIPLRSVRRALKSPPDAGRGADRGSIPQPDQGGGAGSRAVAAGGDVRAGAARRGSGQPRTRPRGPMSPPMSNASGVRFPHTAVATVLAAFGAMASGGVIAPAVMGTVRQDLARNFVRCCSVPPTLSTLLVIF